MFNDLSIFTLFVISIINPLISDDGDFVCYHVISEMLHGDKAAFLYVELQVFVNFTWLHDSDESNALESWMLKQD